MSILNALILKTQKDLDLDIKIIKENLKQLEKRKATTTKEDYRDMVTKDIFNRVEQIIKQRVNIELSSKDSGKHSPFLFQRQEELQTALHKLISEILDNEKY